jgi:hypothetical protein
MAYKVNYALERAERNRLKQERKEAKLRERKAAAAGEKTMPVEDTDTEDTTTPPDSPAAEPL